MKTAYHYIITILLFPFSPFKSFVYFLEHIEGDSVNKEELANELKQYPTTKRLFRL